MKHQLVVVAMVINIGGCTGMPFQGFSTANYAYHPPAVNYSATVTQTNPGSGYVVAQPIPPGVVPYRPGGPGYVPIPPAPIPYAYGGGYSSAYVSGSVYPENAFKSFAESTSNLYDASRDIKGIYNVFGGGHNRYH